MAAKRILKTSISALSLMAILASAATIIMALLIEGEIREHTRYR